MLNTDRNRQHLREVMKMAEKILAYAVAVVVGYLLGCSNMALYLAKWKKVDMRSAGSGNLGASNATILMGWKAGVLTGIHDIGKAVAAVLLIRLLFPGVPYADLVAGACTVLGHIFPVFLRFRGGKGLASFIGMAVAMYWKWALIVLAVFVLITWLTDYIVLGTAWTVIGFPVLVGAICRSWVLFGLIFAVSLVILFKHRENYVRIFRGTEIGFRSAARGDHRKT